MHRQREERERDRRGEGGVIDFGKGKKKKLSCHVSRGERALQNRKGERDRERVNEGVSVDFPKPYKLYLEHYRPTLMRFLPIPYGVHAWIPEAVHVLNPHVPVS